MDLKTFLDTLKDVDAPQNLSYELQALWYDGKGDWERAHDIAQDIQGKSGAHIHAYLHRKEGDQWNAAYWYRLAGQEMPKSSLEQEWKDLARKFLL